MPSLIDIRRRIRSVKNTQQITKAMKMVSAAKLRRAQDRVIASRPYGTLLRKVLGNVAAAAAPDESGGKNPLLAQRPEKRILLVLVTSDKGLAGAFNSNLIKGAQRFIAERTGVEVRMELMGRKGRDFFRKRGATIIGRAHRPRRQGEVRRHRRDRAKGHRAVLQRGDRRGLPASTTNSRAWCRRS